MSLEFRVLSIVETFDHQFMKSPAHRTNHYQIKRLQTIEVKHQLSMVKIQRWIAK